MAQSDITRRLLELFDRERRIILDGRIEDLAGLEAEKVALSSRFEEVRDPRELALVRKKAVQSAELLAAATEGIKSALERVRDIRQQAGTLNTYTADGGRSNHATARGKLERRA